MHVEGNKRLNPPSQRAAGWCEAAGSRTCLTPECELFEWALSDANKSGTAEKLLSSSLWIFGTSKQTEFFCYMDLFPPVLIIGKDDPHMKNYTKYRPGYYMPPETCMDWVKKERITEAPDW